MENPAINDAYQQSIETTVEMMIDFLPETDHSQAEIDQCRSILVSLGRDIEISAARDMAMDAVRKAVVSLNILNDTCEGCLIETGEREEICIGIISLMHEKGFNDEKQDLTEEWREW